MPKNILKKLSISILLSTQIVFLLFFVFLPTTVQAADNLPVWKNPFEDLQVTIPGMDKFSEPAPCIDDPSKTCVKWIGEYIAGIYKYAIGVVGILAAVVLMWGGLNWLTAGGNQGRITEAKAWIGASITGLIIALSSYLILYQVNPDLVNFKGVGVATVIMDEGKITGKDGCCVEGIKCFKKTKDSCTGAWYDEKQACISNCTIDFWNNNFEVEGSWEAPGEAWIFDPGISNQMNDASPQLSTLLNCMKDKLPSGVGRISSISDSHNGAVQGFNDCDTCPIGTTKPGCAHTCQSCHYGGGTSNLSQAVDFGDENNKNSIITAANNCGAGFIKDEGDHVHISDSTCVKD